MLRLRRVGFLSMLLAGAITGCQQNGDPASLHVFSTGFGDAGVLESLGPVTRPENLTIVPDPDDPTNRALRIGVVANDHYGGSFHVRFNDHFGAEPNRAYFRYRLRLDSSWNPGHSGKLPGFGGVYSRAGWGGRPSDGFNGWSARGMFGRLNTDGHTPVGSYVYHADMASTGQRYGNSEWWDVLLERERWHVIEQEIRLETVDATGGRGDGWIRAWVDGELVFDRPGLHVRDTDQLRIESVWVNVYYGGKTPAPAGMSLLIDDLWIGLSRPDAAPREGWGFD